MCVEERTVAALLPVRKCGRPGFQLFPSLPDLVQRLLRWLQGPGRMACGGQGAIQMETTYSF